MSQQKEDFVTSVENAMRFFEGTPAAIVPDNLKSAVIKSSRFEPPMNDDEFNNYVEDLKRQYENVFVWHEHKQYEDKQL
jgi:transposase